MSEQISSEIAEIIGEGLRRREKDQSQRYRPLNLPANPFPLASIASVELAPYFPPVRPRVRSELEGFLRTTSRSRRFAGLRVIGDFGFGKTHLLRWLEYHINQSGKGKIRAFYIDNPGLSPRELLFALTRGIGEEELRKQIWLIILAEFANQSVAQGSAFTESFFPSRRGVPPFQPSLFPQFADRLRELSSSESISNYQLFIRRFNDLKLDKERLKDFGAEALAPIVENLEVVRQLISFALDEKYSAFKSWMALSSGEVRGSLLVPQRDHFRAIINVLKHNEVQYLYLLADEFEDITSARLTKRKQAEYYAALRILIDSHLQDFALIIAVTEGGWKDLISVYPAIEKRFSHFVSLTPLEKAEAGVLVQQYLDFSRRGSEYQDLLGQLTPFTPEAIAALHSSLDRNPRTIIGFCHRLIEQCVDRKLTSIDADLVKDLSRNQAE